MKAIQLVLAAGMLSGFAFAQTAEFIEPRNILNAPQPIVTTYKVKDYTYVLYNSYNKATFKTDMQLDAYDASLKTIGSTMLSEKNADEPSIFEGVFAASDKMVLFRSDWDKASGNVLSYLPLSETGVKQKAVQLITFPAEKMMNTGSYHVNASPDGSKFVVLCELPFIKDSLEHTIVYVYDNNLKQLWKKDYRFPNANGTEKYRYNDVYVNNDGVVFDMKRVPVKKALDYFTVFTFTKNGTDVQERKMDLGLDGHIATYKSGFTSTGDLILAGYCYQDKKAGVNVDRPRFTFYIKVGPDGGMPVDKVTAIPENANLKANYLIVLPDNSGILVGEEELVNSTLKTGTTTGEMDYSYEYDNILVIKFAADGEKKWDHTIMRDVKSWNDGARTLGIAACMMGDNLVITYQDYLWKHDGKPHPIVDPIYGGYRINMLEKINMDGVKVSEGYIQDKRLAGRDSEYALIPATGNKVNDTTLFFVGARRFELVTVKVTL